MKRYCIKSQSGKLEFFDIISENDNDYKIRLTRLTEGKEKVIEETMSRQLFELCMKTGYIYELETVAAVVA